MSDKCTTVVAEHFLDQCRKNSRTAILLAERISEIIKASRTQGVFPCATLSFFLPPRFSAA